MKEGLFQRTAFMLECTNAPYKVATVKKWIDLLEKIGYNTLYYEFSSVFEVDGEPYFNYLRPNYTKEEMKEMDAYARAHGIEMIPIIQTLAHLGHIFRWKAYGQIKDIDDVFLVGEPRVYELVENMIKTVRECFQTKTIHLGMDEAWRLGRGKYCDMHGLKDKHEIMFEHVGKVLDIARKYGFECEMWCDMYMHAAYGDYEGKFIWDKSEEVSKIIPKDVKIIYWDYWSLDKNHYKFYIDSVRKLTDNFLFAGGAWNFFGYCPDNAYGIKATKVAFEACRENGVKEVMLTTWSDDGGEASAFAILPTVVAAYEFSRGNFDMESIKARFKAIVGMDFDEFMTLEQPDRMKCSPNYFALYDGGRLNPTKYLLFQDVFRGIFDSTVYDEGDHFKNASKALEKASKNAEWGYMFKPIKALADVMDVKYNLGIKTREIYKTRDKEKIKALAETEYSELIKRLESFYNEYEAVWLREKKAESFDVQDIRLGGLIQRIKHCQKRLLAYASGEESELSELETELLDFRGNGKEFAKGATTFNSWKEAVTVNYL